MVIGSTLRAKSLFVITRNAAVDAEINALAATIDPARVPVARIESLTVVAEESVVASAVISRAVDIFTTFAVVLARPLPARIEHRAVHAVIKIRAGTNITPLRRSVRARAFIETRIGIAAVQLGAIGAVVAWGAETSVGVRE